MSTESAKKWRDRTMNWADSAVEAIRSSRNASFKMIQKAVGNRDELRRLVDQYVETGQIEFRGDAGDVIQVLIDMLVEVSEEGE